MTKDASRVISVVIVGAGICTASWTLAFAGFGADRNRSGQPESHKRCDCRRRSAIMSISRSMTVPTTSEASGETLRGPVQGECLAQEPPRGNLGEPHQSLRY